MNTEDRPMNTEDRPMNTEDRPMNTEEDNFPTLREELEAAVKSLKKGKSAGVDNKPAELKQAGIEAVTNILTAICNNIWQTGDWPTPWIQSMVITLTKRQPTIVSKLQYNQPNQPPK